MTISFTCVCTLGTANSSLWANCEIVLGSLATRFRICSSAGRYYHDGRFKTLLDVVNHYNTRFSLGLTDQEKSDLVEYLKSLPSKE